MWGGSPDKLPTIAGVEVRRSAFVPQVGTPLNLDQVRTAQRENLNVLAFGGRLIDCQRVPTLEVSTGIFRVDYGPRSLFVIHPSVDFSALGIIN